jgi:Zn ribbon nucleic-acid-binding protein
MPDKRKNKAVDNLCTQCGKNPKMGRSKDSKIDITVCYHCGLSNLMKVLLPMGARSRKMKKRTKEKT